MSRPRFHLLLLFFLLASAACVQKSPAVRVLGIKSAPAQGTRPLKVFIEVENPTKKVLSLSRLEYRLAAPGWFDTRGEVLIERAVAAGGTAVVGLRVPYEPQGRGASATLVLEARLFAVENRVERSWDLRATGALHQDSRGVRLVPVEVAEAP